jgi:hypothetical protein
MLAAEQQRLNDARQEKVPWKKWGPYLSERQWGTVREDYSEGGDAWNFFTHDHARSRAHRNVATVALANKLARIAWAVLAKNEPYRPPVLADVAAA